MTEMDKMSNSNLKMHQEEEEETEVMEIDLSGSGYSNKDKMEKATQNHLNNNHMEDDDEDEPDAMAASEPGVKSGKKTANGYKGQSDGEEDDRLVIDDTSEEALAKSMLKSGQALQDQIYSCRKCDLITTSPKAYLYHLDTVHKVTDGKSLMSNSVMSDVSGSNNRNGFLNLSIPLRGNGSSAAVDDYDEDGDEEMQDSSQASLNLSALNSSMPLDITAGNIDKMFDDDKKKKKKTRQEVDPGKYFEAVDSSGTKYACSQCGNVYKWRKSLNKHWKEKHLRDPLVEVASPPGMLELLKSGKYTQLGSRRIYDNTFLATIKTQKDDPTISHRSTPNSVPNSPSPPSFLNASHVLNQNAAAAAAAAAARLVVSMAPGMQPKMIGPFVANGAQPVFPGMGLAIPHIPLQNPMMPTTDNNALDLTRENKVETNNYSSPFSHSVEKQNVNNAPPPPSGDQDQPLDFSRKKDETSVPVKHEKQWEMASSSMKHSNNNNINPATPKLYRCSKCDYSSTSESDFAAHTGSHYNKRMVKCFECKQQMNSMEELNLHFSNDHTKKLTEYKEAIKKIPHGLQQTYHLLKMDLHSIGELNNQDLGSSDAKSLKCKKCDFEAKWPAELQKHAVSHSEERPYICMVCGSTYKWKWDLVKHFQKSHPVLPNPYRRNDKRDTPDASSEDELEDEPEIKKSKMSASHNIDSPGANFYNPDDAISVEGIIAATQAGQRFVSSQPTLMDNDFEQNFALMRNLPLIGSPGVAGLALTPELAARHYNAQRASQEAFLKSRQNGNIAKKTPTPEQSPSPGGSSGKGEQLPYKCTMCNYHARWPSEVTQHMKNHSDSKPYLCPRCDYRSKWKWDVVKHLKRCGGGTISDVIDTTKLRRKDNAVNGAPPNAVVSPLGKVKRMTPQALSFIQSVDANGHPGAVVFHQGSDESNSASAYGQGDMESNERDDHDYDSNNDNFGGDSHDSDMELIDLTVPSNNNNNNDESRMDSNVNNNYAAYISGQPVASEEATPLPASNASLLSPSQNTGGVDLSKMASPSSSSSPLPQSSPQIISTPPSGGRQNSSGEIWNCPHCPFSTQSQAELKRHSGVHKDDKPFKCDECHYSTRWACDLKKHRKSYDHYPKRNNSILPNNMNGDKDTVPQNLMENQGNDDKTMMPVESKPRFKCFQCSTFFVSLLDLIEHRKASHTEKDQSSPSAPETKVNHEIDAARIKHPRKQIKQLSCSKCPFVCKNRQTMDQHMDEHEEMEKNAFHCFYCSSQFMDKENLLDHIVSHQSFNPKEWETFFMICEEDEQQLLQQQKQLQQQQLQQQQQQLQQQQQQQQNKDEMKVMAEKISPFRQSTRSDMSVKKDSSSMSASEAATQARIQQILNEIPKQKSHAVTPTSTSTVTSTPQASAFNKFKCEWCPAEFINLTSVYKHASQAHPIQLKEQDNTMSQAYANLQNKSHDSTTPTGKSSSNISKPESVEALESLKQQIAEKRHKQMTEKIQHMVSTNQKVQEVLNRRLEEEDKLGAKKYQCDKCTFSSPSRLTFQRHYELHGGNLSTQCWFCDYRVDRMELLYHHMKISHTRKWKALSQDPLYASQIQRMNLAYGNSSSSGNNNDSPPGRSPTRTPMNAGAMDLSSKRSPIDTTGHDILYTTKLQYTWSGIPVNVVPSLDQNLKFGCPICVFTDASIGNTCTHVMQSHSAMPKFRCKMCEFSDDNVHIMSDHCKTSHPVSERFVEVLDFKQLSITDIQMIQLNFMKENLPGMVNKARKAVGTSSAQNDNNNTTPAKFLSCPFCPYQSPTKEKMKQHILHHNSDSRFQCEQCDFSVDSPSIMSEHVKVHQQNYKTMEESSGTGVKMELKPEQGGHSDINGQPTKVKETAEIALSSGSDVIKSASPKTKTSGRIRYRCSVCPYHTTCKSNIFKHKRQHNIPKRYKCNHCSYSAARAVLLKNHIESHSIPVEEDSYFHDIFYDPNGSIDDKSFVDGDDVENEMEEGDDESSISDDLENEMDTKAIADLEAKDIMAAEAVFKVSTAMTEDQTVVDNSVDKQFRKQKCSHCPFSSNSAYEFKKHINFHGTQDRYKCDHCNYSIDRLNLLSQHRKLHCDEPNYNPNPSQSVLLNTSFILQQNELLKQSQEGTDLVSKPIGTDNLISETPQYSCPHCPFKISCQNSFEIHTTSHGQKKLFICDYCDWSADRIQLLNHHRKVHENEPTFLANPDKLTFLNKEFDDGTSGEFEAKLMEMPNTDKMSKEGGDNDGVKSPPFKLTVIKKSYPCKLCPYKTNSKSSYQFHASMHGGNADFKCTMCDFSAINRGILQQHIVLHSSSSPSSSQHSPPLPRDGRTGEGEESSSSSHETESAKGDSSSPHKTKVSELTCDRCPFTATSAIALKDHLKGHNLQEQLLCPYCDFGATSREVIFPHIQIHFPGTKLEVSAMEKMLEGQSGKINNNKMGRNSNNNNNNNDVSNPNNNNKKTNSVEDMSIRSPQVVSNSSSNKDVSSEMAVTGNKDTSQVIKTKIYVCQYCEREFEAKTLMIQHEKQHLVGSMVE